MAGQPSPWELGFQEAATPVMGSLILVLQAILRPGEVTLHTLSAMAGA